MRIRQRHSSQRTPAGHLAAGQLLISQRRGISTGNQTMQRVLQAKPAVNQPGDQFEQEAEHVAASVMSSGVPPVQRMCDECEEELHRKPGPRTEVPAGAFEHPTGGRPLPQSERSFFEPRFGRDFSSVRIHADSRAASEAASSVNALAYTMRNDIVFAKGQYRPGTSSGRSLLAHELTHVVQQGDAETPAVQRFGAPSQAPAGLGRDIANSTPADPVLVNDLFSVSSSELTPEDITNLDSFVDTWHAIGADRAVRVDGFASTDGPEALNWTLSCDRAETVVNELTNPSSGTPGINPDTGGNPEEAGTILDPSNSNSLANPERNTLANFAALLCPPPTGSVCRSPDP